MTQTEVRPRAAELFERMPAVLAEAAHAGRNLSIHLEELDPSDGYKDGLDAFGRQLKVANGGRGIRVRSDPARGYYADEFSAFDQSESARALVPEFLARIRRRVTTGRDVNTRALYQSDDQQLNSWARPYVDAAAVRMKQIAPAIPLSELVAVTTPISGDAYRAFYLTDNAAQARLVRVTEGAEMPRAKLVGGERTVRLYKYGRILEVSYETLRRQRVDMVALHIARLAVQAETDKVATVLDVIVNGDGNSGTAATSHNLTTLDTAAAAGTLTLKGWLAFKLKLANPYAVTTALAREATALQMMLLNMGSANVPLVTVQGQLGFGGFRPINPELSDNVALGITSEAPSLKIVAFDNRFAIERVTEIGADIQETQRWVTRQVQALALSEVEGYAVLDANASIILDVNA
jgi:hypothetical protein